jgi:hypothetical protein
MVDIPASELKRYNKTFDTMIGNEVIIQDDGYYVFCPDGSTAFSPTFLQFIVDKICDLNYDIYINEGGH